MSPNKIVISLVLFYLVGSIQAGYVVYSKIYIYTNPTLQNSSKEEIDSIGETGGLGNFSQIAGEISL
jgi:glycerol-3-phosphate acyltransferase PlsY